MFPFPDSRPGYPQPMLDLKLHLPPVCGDTILSFTVPFVKIIITLYTEESNQSIMVLSIFKAGNVPEEGEPRKQKKYIIKYLYASETDCRSIMGRSFKRKVGP